MALVEIRTRLVRTQIKRIDQGGIGSIGGIIDRMAVGIGNTKSQRASASTNGSLQGVVVGVGDVLQGKDLSKTGSKRAQAIRVRDTAGAEACRLEVDVGRAGRSHGT